MKKNLLLLGIQILLSSTLLFAITPTPTPTPKPLELTCDSRDITTKAYDIHKETKERLFIFLDTHAEASTSSIRVNKHSTQLINNDGV